MCISLSLSSVIHLEGFEAVEINSQRVIIEVYTRILVLQEVLEATMTTIPTFCTLSVLYRFWLCLTGSMRLMPRRSLHVSF